MKEQVSGYWQMRIVGYFDHVPIHLQGGARQTASKNIDPNTVLPAISSTNALLGSPNRALDEA